MIRKWVAKLNKSIAGSVVSTRKGIAVPVKIWFEPDRNTGRLMPIENLVITGETSDLSRSGIAFIVASIRIHENYLVGEGRTLNAELDLPGGKVRMQIIGRRYEQVGEHVSTARYLVGAEITKMSDGDRESYNDFLKFGNKRKRRSLELGIDKG
ncbi:MAG: hypothetical protein IPN69_24440 [Acidobacteria bacterium]|nr:hypothetical protein [Acidobacteriota bacterium]MBK8149388.1 hypothetical protein [Acidobacteriota bacterium]MBK8813859.1 hypothetical protein [Acidobacteriota bacterium]